MDPSHHLKARQAAVGTAELSASSFYPHWISSLSLSLSLSWLHMCPAGLSILGQIVG